MRIVVYVMIALAALMMLLCYSLLVVASRADEREERMHKDRKEKADD